MADDKKPLDERVEALTIKEGPFKGQMRAPADWPGSTASQRGGFGTKGVKSYSKGGIVGPNVQKWGSPKVSAPCKDTKTLSCK